MLEKISPVVGSLNYELRDVDIRSGQPAMVRVTIDIADRTRGVTLDDCYEVHKVLDPLFDVWDPFERNYTLEVSSPGEKAPIRSAQHFEEAIGEEIEFKTREALGMPSNPTAAPRKNWKGRLRKVLQNESANHQIEIEDPLGIHLIDAEQIETARWLRNWKCK